MANPCNYILNVDGKEIKIPVGDDVALAKALHDADLKSLHDSGVIKLTRNQIDKLGSMTESEPVVDIEKEVVEQKPVIQKQAEKISMKPKDFESMYKVHRVIFGLGKEQALAATIVTDNIISTIAKRGDMTKDEAYSKLEYRKGDLDTYKELTSEEKNALFQQEAWHGSPHDFERFTTEKMGTGEGAQAFGWGLYFTDIKDIAEKYQSEISRNKNFELWVGDNTAEGLASKYYQRSDRASNSNLSIKFQDMANFFDVLASKFSFSKALKELEHSEELQKWAKEKVLPQIKGDIGKLYKVNLHEGKSPSEYTWVDWDKPIGDNIKDKIIKKFLEETGISKEKFEQLKEEGIEYADHEIAVDLFEEYGIPYKDGVAMQRLLDSKINGNVAYNILETYFNKSPKEASLFLLRAGIDGIKYPTDTLSHMYGEQPSKGSNYVVFDEAAVTIKEKVSFQGAKAAVVLAKDGSAIIHSLTDPNVSSPLHEISHVYERYLTDKEREIILKNAGHTEWGDNTSEHFARGFEKYLSDGIAPDKNMQNAFNNFKTWLTDIYNGVKGSDIDIKLNKPMKNIYDSMLGFNPELKKNLEAELSKMKIKSDNLQEKSDAVRNGITNLTQIIKESLNNKELTKGQFNSIMNNISKITSARDVNKAIDNAVDFIDKVINQSDWDTKNRELKNARLKAIKNLSNAKIDKLDSTVNSLKRMLSINPDLIPDSSLADYNEVINKMADVSKLTDTSKLELVRKADMIVNDFEKQHVENLELSSKIDQFVVDFPDMVDKPYGEIIDNMFKNDIITSEQQDYLKRNKEFFTEYEKRENKKKEPLTDEQKTEVKNTINDNIASFKADMYKNKDDFFDDSSRTVIDGVLDSISDEYIDSLSDKELNDLNQNISLLMNGYVSSSLNTKTLQSIKTFNAAKEIVPELQAASVKSKDFALNARAKAAGYRLYKALGGNVNPLEKKALYQQMMRYQKRAVDYVLGLKDEKIFKTVFAESARKYGAHQAYVSDIMNKAINPLNNYVENNFGGGTKSLLIFKKGNPAEIMRDKIRLSLYMIQRMHQPNTVNIHVKEYFGPNFFKGNNYYSEATQNMIKQELAAFESAGYDPEAYLNSFGGKRVEPIRKVISKLDSFYSGDISKKASATSYFDNGKVLTNTENYFPIVFKFKESQRNNLEKELTDKTYSFLNPSFKAGNIIEKTGDNGGVDKILDVTDPVGHMESYAQEVSLRYHMLNEVRNISSLIRKLRGDKNLGEEQNAIIDMIDDLYKRSVGNSVSQSGSLTGPIGKISGIVAKTKLVGINKSINELGSNIVNSSTHLASFARGISVLKSLNDSKIDIDKVIYSLGFSQGGRILNEILSMPKLVNQGSADIPFEKRIENQRDVPEGIRKALINAKKMSGAEDTARVIEDIHELFLVTPDKMVAKNLVFGLFDKAFSELTNGESPDYKKIQDGDVEYLDKYKKQIKDAVTKANNDVSGIISTKNPFEVSGKYQSNINDKDYRKLFTQFQSFFRNHSNGFGTELYISTQKAVSNGLISKEAAKAILSHAAKYSSQYAYNVGMRGGKTFLFNSVVAPIFGLIPFEDDEKKEKRFLRDNVAAALGVYTANSGAFFANGVSFGSEMVNHKYLQDVTYKGQYNRDKAFGFSSYDPEATASENLANYTFSNVGSLGIGLSAGKDIVKTVLDEGNYGQAILTGFGSVGLFPFWKDFDSQSKMAEYGSTISIEDQVKKLDTEDFSYLTKMDDKRQNFLNTKMYNYYLALQEKFPQVLKKGGVIDAATNKKISDFSYNYFVDNKMFIDYKYRGATKEQRQKWKDKGLAKSMVAVESLDLHLLDNAYKYANKKLEFRKNGDSDFVKEMKALSEKDLKNKLFTIIRDESKKDAVDKILELNAAGVISNADLNESLRKVGKKIMYK